MAELCLKREQFIISVIMLKTMNSLYFCLNIYWNLCIFTFPKFYPKKTLRLHSNNISASTVSKKQKKLLF